MPRTQELIPMPRGMSRFGQEEFARIAQTATELRARNPGMNLEVVNAYLRDYAQADIEHLHALNDLKARARSSGIVPDERWLRSENLRMRQEFVNNFVNNTLPSYGEEGREAWTQVANKLKPVSIPGAVVRQFYNEDKGGLRWAGLIGGLLGGMFIFNNLGGFGGGPLAFIGGALAMAAGAWLANMGSESIGGFVNKHITGRGRQKGGAEPEAQVTEPQRVQETQRTTAADLGKIVPNNVISRDMASLSSSMNSVDETQNFTPGSTPASPGNTTTPERDTPAAGR